MNELPLRDIHLPEAVSWWPLAIGWWLLPLLVILITYAIYKLVKHRQLNKKVPYRKIALGELGNIRAEFKNQDDSIELIRAISALLRRIALSYLPRENIASLTGKRWIQQLNKLSTQSVFTDDISALLEHAPYMKQNKFKHNELLSICEQWIKGLPETNNPDMHYPEMNRSEIHTGVSQ